MSQMKVDTITDVAGTGAPAFSQGIKADAITDLAGTGPVDFTQGLKVSGTTLAVASPGVSDGLLSSDGMLGYDDGTEPGAGYVGQVLTVNLLTLISQASPTSGTWYDVTGISLSVPAGNWLITAGSATLQAEISGASGTLLRLGLGIRVGSTVLDEVQASIGLLSGSITYAQSMHIPSYYHSSSSTQDIKLSMRAFKDTGSGTLANLYARGDLVAGGQGNFIKAIRMP